MTTKCTCSRSAATSLTDIAFIVTTAEEVHLPVFAGSDFSLPAGQLRYWWVETHGSYATVDDAASSTGFIDAYAGTGAPRGPRRGTGTFAQSENRRFTTAP